MLDRVLVSVQWEVMFPLCSLKEVMRIGSDHSPLLFSSEEGPLPRTARFHFEPSWLLQPGFLEAVRLRWVQAEVSPPRVFCAVDIWHHFAKSARHVGLGGQSGC